MEKTAALIAAALATLTVTGCRGNGSIAAQPAPTQTPWGSTTTTSSAARGGGFGGGGGSALSRADAAQAAAVSRLEQARPGYSGGWWRAGSFGESGSRFGARG